MKLESGATDWIKQHSDTGRKGSAYEVYFSSQKKSKRIWNHKAPWLSYINWCQHRHCSIMTDCAVYQPRPEPWHSNRDNKSTAGLNACTYTLHIKPSTFTAMKRHKSNVLAERAEPQRISSFSCLLLRKETGGWDMYRCVITQHVCAALTNLIWDRAAKTPAPYSTSWCDRPIITQDYPELPSLCFFPLSFPDIMSENWSKQCWVAGEWMHEMNKPAVEDTVNENFTAACQRIVQTVHITASFSSWSSV